MKTEHVAGNIWKVHSDSSSKVYIVDLDESSCTCPNWAIERNRRVGAEQASGRSGNNVRYACKHIQELGGAGTLPKAKAKKLPPKVDTAEQAKAKADSIVARFTNPGMKKRAIETLRQAAQLKKDQ